jgi:hypothetical protein
LFGSMAHDDTCSSVRGAGIGNGLPQGQQNS